MALVPVKTVVEGQLPFKKGTIYKFSSLRRYPEVILRIDGSLFWDENAWQKLVDDVRERQIAEAKRLDVGGLAA